MERKLELREKWNYKKAVVEYQLVQSAGPFTEVLATGDYAWAVRTALHFGLETPTLGGDDD